MNNDNIYVADIISTISHISTSETLEDILSHLSGFSKQLGFTHAGIGQIINPTVLGQPICNFGIADFPDDFQEQWFKKGYIMHDPVLRYALSCRCAFTWREAYEYATRYGQKIIDEASEYGLQDGVAIPVMVGRYPMGLISLVHPKPLFANEDLAKIELVCIHSYTQMLRVLNAKEEDRTIALSVREIDVLHYVAAGKTNWEVGKILGITEDAIKMHMKSISRKLDAANRAHSVSIGIRMGQILP